jgi:hypothetical protein
LRGALCAVHGHADGATGEPGDPAVLQAAMTACMRKLLTILNTLMKNAVAWKNLSTA